MSADPDDVRGIRRIRRIVSSALVGLLVALVLPLYLFHDMTRATLVGRGGDRITYEWRLGGFGEFLADMRYMSPEQSPGLLLAVNVALALVYAAALACAVDLARRRLQR